jgi:transmembrane sensor
LLASTTTGEKRESVMPDGSVIDLAPKTSITVTYNRQNRTVEMLSGEAFYKVSSDKHRPFVVKAGLVTVTAVGTAFDVKTQGLKTLISVQEGVVVVEKDAMSRDSRGATIWRLSPGQQLRYSDGGRTVQFGHVDSSSALAWREGRLEYIETPLEDVVADLNRYSSREIQIENTAITGLRFTGTVFTNNVDSWLLSLPRALPVRVDYPASGPVLVTLSRHR